MLREAIKTVVVIVMVLILGAVAGDLDVIESTRIGDWYLGDLVRLVTFGAAAFLSLKLALGIGRSEIPPVLGSPGLSRITQLLVGAGGIWFLHNGLEVVVGREWRGALNVGTSILILALLAFVVGVVEADSRQPGGLAGPSAVVPGVGGVVELDDRRAVRVLQLKQWAIGRSL